MTDHLFVYGTLRRGQDGRVHPLLEPECTFVGPAFFRGVLYDLGPYPAVVPSERPADRVAGELYRTDEPEPVLARLDIYEGDEYARERAEVTTEDGARTEAWIYLYRSALSNAKRIPSGDYRDM